MCKQLEELWAKKIGAKYAVTFTSGTATLHSALNAIGVKSNDEVIVPALGVIMTANAVIYQNAIPVFADVEEDTFNINPDDIRKKITSKTEAIMPIATYGLPPNMDEIMEIAEEHNLAVIEDNAEAVGAVYKGKNLGTIGDISSFSLENSKCFVCGDGGIVTTNSEKLAGRLRAFQFHGYNVLTNVHDPHTAKNIFQDPDYKRHVSFGWSYKLPEVACAIAISQVERWQELIDLRCKIAKLYDEVVDNCDFMTSQHASQGYKNVYWTYAVKFEGNKNKWRRFRKTYMKNGGDGIYACWSLVYDEPVYKKRLFDSRIRPINLKQPCPVAEKLQPKIMQFCTNYGSKAEALPKVEALRKTIKEFEI